MKKIVVAEDSTEIRDLLLEIANNTHSIIRMDAGFNPDLFKEEDIDLALIEISDPINQRLDLIQTILDLDQDIKILLVVDPGMFDLTRSLLTDNVFDYILKPIDTKELKKKINPSASIDPDIDFTGLLGRITTEIAHRIKNPLTTIRTFTSLLNERFDDPEFRDAFYKLCLNEIARIDETIERLTSYSLLERPVPTTVDLVPILNDTINKIMDRQALHRNDIRILTELQGYIPPVFVDGMHMKLILENILLFISMDTVEGGEVRIRSSASPGNSAERILIEISYPFRRTGLDDNGLFVIDLFLARRFIGYQGGELDVRIINEYMKVISISLPYTVGIEGIMRLDLHAYRTPLDTKIESMMLNYYDRRRSYLSIPFSERRINGRRKGMMSLYRPEKRQILGVFTHPCLLPASRHLPDNRQGQGRQA